VFEKQPDTRPGMVMLWYRHGNASDYLEARKPSTRKKIGLVCLKRHKEKMFKFMLMIYYPMNHGFDLVV
jgi:hypothetical protein